MASVNNIRLHIGGTLFTALLGSAVIPGMVGCEPSSPVARESVGAAREGSSSATRAEAAEDSHVPVPSEVMRMSARSLESIWRTTGVTVVSSDGEVPTHEVYFTWTDMITDHPLYFWMDAAVGRGDEGFRRVLANLRTCGPGTRVLIYPVWQSPPRSAPDMLWLPPWSRTMEEELVRIVEERGLYLILSPKDHRGMMRPEPEGKFLNTEEIDGVLNFVVTPAYSEAVKE